ARPWPAPQAQAARERAAAPRPHRTLRTSSVCGGSAGTDPAGIAGMLCKLLEPSDVPLALGAHGIIGRKVGDQSPDPVPDLKREMRRGRACERADVIDRDPPPRRESIRALGFAHPPVALGAVTAFS